MKDDPKRTLIERDGGGLEPYRGPWALLAPIRAGREFVVRRLMALLARFRPPDRERPLTAAELDELLLGPLPAVDAVSAPRVAALPSPPNPDEERLHAALAHLRVSLDASDPAIDPTVAIAVRGDRADRVADLLHARLPLTFATPGDAAALRRAFLADRVGDRPQRAGVDVATLPDDPRLGLPDTVLSVALDAAALRTRLAHLAHVDRAGRRRGTAPLAIALGALRRPEGGTVVAAPLALALVHVDVADDDTYTIVGDGGGVRPNEPLHESLRREGLQPPTTPDGIVLERWFDLFAAAVADRADWVIDRTFVALAPMRVHRAAAALDLADPAWGDASDLAGHPVVAPLLRGQFPAAPDAVPAEGRLDEALRRADLRPVLPQDAAQAAVAAQAFAQPALLVQGGPGTGKTRALVNLIATAAARNQKVLLVASRPSALDDAWRELHDAGLAPLLLPLHGERTATDAAVTDLIDTLAHPLDPGPAPALAEPVPPDDLLRVLHTPVGRSDVTPFALLSRVVAHPDLPPLDPATVGADVPLDDRSARLDRLLEIAEEVEAWIAEHGVIGDHPYRHVGVDALTPALERRWRDGLDLLQRAADALEHALGRLPAAVFAANPPTMRDIDAFVDLAEALTAVMSSTRLDVAADVWRRDRATLRVAATAAVEARTVRLEGAAVAAPEAWDETAATPEELDALHDDLQRRQDPVYRMFDDRYRAAAEGIRAFLPLDARPEPRVLRAAVVALRAHAHARRRFDEARGAWVAALPDGGAIDAAAQVAPAVLALCDRLDALPSDLGAAALASLPALGTEGIADVARRLADARDAMRQGLSEAQIALRLDLPALMRPRGQGIHAARGGAPATEVLDVHALLAQVRRWLAEPDGAAAGARWRRIRVRATQAGFGRLVEAVVEGAVEPVDLAGRLRVAIERKWLATAIAESPTLAGYDRRAYQASIEAFVAAQGAREARHRHDLAAAHAAAVAAARGLPEALRAAEREGLSLRRLLAMHGAAVQAIKPIFAVSLPAVAALLPPERRFDLVVIDGAGAASVAEALPALLRAARLVAFDDPSAPHPDPAWPPASGATLAEALAAAGVKRVALTTPYRPLHPSVVDPATARRWVNADRAAVTFTHLPKGRFDAAKRVHRSEARAVAKAVRAHAHEHPDRSLLVVAFLAEHAAAIRAEVASIALTDAPLAAFLAERGEPFAVVVAEDAPAFTRDRAIVSFGVGPDPKGAFGDALASLRGDAGRRALQAAFTRSRDALHAFAAFTDHDLPDEPDLVSLRAALRALREGPPSESPLPNAFEEVLAVDLTRRGFVVERHPGSFPSLALASAPAATRPGVALLSDAPAMQAIRSTDERERLIPAALHARGWRVARVSSLDWVRDPDAVVADLHAALAEPSVPAARPARVAPFPEPFTPPTPAVPTTEAEGVLSFPPYVKADLARVIPAGMPLADAPLKDLARAFARIATVEAPVHREDAFRRILAAAGARTGSRIRARLEEGLQRAVASGEIVALDDHLLPPALDPLKLTPRDRGALDARERDVAHVAGIEIDAALLAIVRARSAVAVDELPALALRLLGFPRAAARTVEVRLGQLVAAGRLRLERSGDD